MGAVRLAEAATEEQRPAGGMVLHQSDRAWAVHFLVTGSVQILLRVGDELLDAVLRRPGELLGWSAFRAPYRYTRGVSEVDRGRDQQVLFDEGLRCAVARSPSPMEVSCGLVVRLPGAAPQPRAGPALLPLGGGQRDRDPGIAPRARGATPPASTAPHAPEGPGAACGAEPPAPTGAVVGVPGATRDAAALAPAHGGPALDLPIQIQGPTSDIRTGAAAGRAACPRESAVGLPADPWRAVAAWLAGVASSIRRILCAHGLDPAPRCGRHGVGCRGRECGRRGRADSPDVLAAGIPAQGKRELSGRAERWGRTAAREYQRLAPVIWPKPGPSG